MKFNHTSITVKDMEKSLDFYTKILGLEFERRVEIPENKAEIAFVRDPQSGMRIELTYWKEKKDFTDGDQLDHMGFEVPDVAKAVEEFRKKGVPVAKEPYRIRQGSGLIAFITDPNGIWLELVERR
jgi:lactoylglutathione lyase